MASRYRKATCRKTATTATATRVPTTTSSSRPVDRDSQAAEGPQDRITALAHPSYGPREIPRLAGSRSLPPRNLSVRLRFEHRVDQGSANLRLELLVHGCDLLPERPQVRDIVDHQTLRLELTQRPGLQFVLGLLFGRLGFSARLENRRLVGGGERVEDPLADEERR